MLAFMRPTDYIVADATLKVWPPLMNEEVEKIL